MTANFEEDFEDVLLTRKTHKHAKVTNKMAQIADQMKKESHTYLLLTTVLDDLVHVRRGKRIAFERWVHAVRMQGSRVSVYRAEYTKKEVGTAVPDGDEDLMGNDDEPAMFILDEEKEFELHQR
jgi:hypothetical protein